MRNSQISADEVKMKNFPYLNVNLHFTEHLISYVTFFVVFNSLNIRK